ncbi:MAG: hypothetical protein WCD86_10710 [Ktedonobacteraceae bacterium]
MRHPGSHARIIDPAHFEAAFAIKSRGRVMVYRDWLCTLSPTVSGYVAELCHKRRDELSQQILALYDLAQELDKADFVVALELAAEQQMYGAEYVRAIVALPSAQMPPAARAASPPLLPTLPTQQDVERDLAQYEQYVANRDDLALVTGGRA